MAVKCVSSDTEQTCNFLATAFSGLGKVSGLTVGLSSVVIVPLASILAGT
jgi:hypothetical protein